MGEAIRGFTSESATVVVGTVIDPEMADELRVTLVVTGLGQTDTDHRNIVNQPVENRRTDGLPDYNKLDRPAVMRKQPTTVSSASIPASSKPVLEPVQEVEYLEYSAFLRRQDKYSFDFFRIIKKENMHD